jgi:glycosyltransferase involved in cell wall biosynthesis
VGGPTEIVDDGATGYLVPPGRPDLIAERVLALLQDAELHRRLGLAARGAVKERFELRRYAAGFSKVLEALAADQAV